MTSRGDRRENIYLEDADKELFVVQQGMRQLNGVYTQRFNRKKQRVGHVFHGRYNAIIVQKWGRWVAEVGTRPDFFLSHLNL